MTGTEGALKAMEGNEKLTNKTYEEASQWDLTSNALSIIQRNLEDERSHIRYIQMSLRDRIWERKGTRTQREEEATL